MQVYHFSRKPRTEHNPLKNGILMIRLDLVPWLETTTAVGMDQPVRCAPIPLPWRSPNSLRPVSPPGTSRVPYTPALPPAGCRRSGAFDEIAVRQPTANEKRKAEAERREASGAADQVAMVQ